MSTIAEIDDMIIQIDQMIAELERMSAFAGRFAEKMRTFRLSDEQS